jgi:hypothetical protein
MGVKQSIQWGDGVGLSPGELTFCGQSQRKHHKFRGRRQGVGQSLQRGNGLLRNGSRILGKRLTEFTVLPVIVLVMTVTVLLPDTTSPPPCEVKHNFSGFTQQWGDGVGSRRGEPSHAAGKVRESTTSSMNRRGKVAWSIQ